MSPDTKKAAGGGKNQWERDCLPPRQNAHAPLLRNLQTWPTRKNNPLNVCSLLKIELG